MGVGVQPELVVDKFIQGIASLQSFSIIALGFCGVFQQLPNRVQKYFRVSRPGRSEGIVGDGVSF